MELLKSMDIFLSLFIILFGFLIVMNSIIHIVDYSKKKKRKVIVFELSETAKQKLKELHDKN